MKYETARIQKNGKWETIDITRLSEVEVENLAGELYCPEEGCTAKLFAVHNSKDGGRTFHFKATNDSHIEDCSYRIENFKARVVNVPTNGYFTEKQVNDFVRNLHKDVTMPLEEKERRKKERQNKQQEKGTQTVTGEKTGDGNVVVRKTTSKGKIIYGVDEIDGVKGRMSRRYEVNTTDIGREVGVYGILKSMKFDEYGQLHIKFKDTRYENIEVLVGGVYKANNSNEYEYLDKVRRYFVQRGDADTFFVAAGLVIEHKGKLMIELQAKYSFRIEGATIAQIMTDDNIA